MNSTHPDTKADTGKNLDLPIIRGIGLKRHYRRGVETVKALDGVDVEIRQGEMVAFVGPSGAGKTTLMNILSCLDKLTEGTLYIGGQDVSQADEETLTRIRRDFLGFVFQRFYLIPTLTVRENVEMPLIFHERKTKHRKNSESHEDNHTSIKKAQKTDINKTLGLVNLLDRSNHLPRELSGGQMQRVAIARALVGNPKIILADEPTGNLDSKNSEEILDLFLTLSRENNITIIISTHDLNLASRCDRILHVLDGKIQTNP